MKQSETNSFIRLQAVNAVPRPGAVVRFVVFHNHEGNNPHHFVAYSDGCSLFRFEGFFVNPIVNSTLGSTIRFLMSLFSVGDA